MSALKKNDVVTLNIEGLTSEGHGVARYDGRAVFVRFAIPGEIVTAHILSVKKTAAYAKILRVVEPSPERTEPVCSVFGKCGGCDFQHMTYAEELRHKRQRVSDALRRIGGEDCAVPSVVPSPRIYSYRNKALFETARGKNGAPSVGFFRERSHDVIDVRDCPLQTETANRAAETLRCWMRDNGAAVRNLFVRTGELSAQAVVVAERDGDFRALADLLMTRCPELTGVSLCVNTSGGNTVLRGEFRSLRGGEYFTDTLCGNEFRLSPDAFYQVNRAVAERIYSDVCAIAAVSAADTALDLYCGAGTITLALAREAGRVFGAEIVPAAVANARLNASRNGITNAEFICGDAGIAVRELSERGVKPRVAVVDPPRRGLAADALAALAELAPERIIYVSCDPATLARDVKSLREHGYALESAQPYDMFPRCAHVETVVSLRQTARQADTSGRDKMTQNNYETQAENARLEFVTWDQAPMIRRYGLRHDDASLFVEFFGETHRIDRETGCVFRDDDGQPAGHSAVMSIYDALCYVKPDAFLSGDWLSLANLSPHSNFGAADRDLFNKTAGHFAGRTAELRRVCHALGGREETRADAGFRFDAFPFLPVIFQFWDGDEEFSPRINFLFDANTLRYIRFETAWYVAGYLTALIESALSRGAGDSP